MTKIPKIIHYCWFGKQPLPESSIKCIESWKKYCPDYNIIRWDEDNFDIHTNEYVEEAYNFRKWAFVTDYVRLYAVYEYGGVYLDTDVELIRSIDNLLENAGFMGFESERSIATGLGFGAEKNNSIVHEILKDYDSISFVNEDGSFDLTPCPERNTKVLVKLGLTPNNIEQQINDFVFLPTDYLSPINYQTGERRITSNTYAIHHYSASWLTDAERKSHQRKVEYCRKYGRTLGRFIFLLKEKVEVHGLIGGVYQTIKRTALHLPKRNID